jgi:hypothetical protein
LENTFTIGQNDLKMLKEKKDWKSLHNFNVEKDIYKKKKKKCRKGQTMKQLPLTPTALLPSS